MKKILALCVLLLAGCASNNSRNQTVDVIRQQMNQAAQESSQPVKPDTVNEALLPPLDVEMLKVEGKPVEPKFDLAVNDTPAAQVFMAIVSGTRYSMLLHPDVAGNISLNLKNVTVFEALDAVREMYGYDYKVDGARIFVQPLTLQTRIFQVNYLTGNRAGTSSIRVSSSALTDSSSGASSGGQNANQGTTIVGGGSGAAGGDNKNLKFERGTDNSSKVTTTTSTDFWDELSRALNTIVGNAQGRSVVISPMSGVIVIRALPDELKNVTAYLKASQISIERQVILEAKIIDVQLNDSFQSGVNWSAFKNGLNSHVSAGLGGAGSILNPAAAGVAGAAAISSAALSATPGATLLPAATGAGTLFGLAFQTSNFAVLLNFLESQGDVHVLSSPRIATLNNQKAVLKVGTDAFFVTEISGGSQATVNVAGTAPTVKLQPFFSGIALDVTPRIDENNEVILHVHPSVSSVSTVTTTLNLGTTTGTYLLPLASSSVSETDSIVRARDGQIVAIGGLMRQDSTNSESGLPGLSKMLFGQTSKLNNKRELVILIKPTVVDNDKDWSDDIAHSRDRVESITKQIRNK
ncbi:MAG: secretin N-terminal domain-containing protein [Proteobacteria bacterium]|nr:secretin N-terminal domain-containing protein [Pseudomonadota bacterium]